MTMAGQCLKLPVCARKSGISSCFFVATEWLPGSKMPPYVLADTGSCIIRDSNLWILRMSLEMVTLCLNQIDPVSGPSVPVSSLLVALTAAFLSQLLSGRL